MTVDRDTIEAVELIDLGAASVETQGGGEDIFDLVYKQPQAGLSND
jgi:hypothetical protein